MMWFGCIKVQNVKTEHKYRFSSKTTDILGRERVFVWFAVPNKITWSLPIRMGYVHLIYKTAG